MAMAPAQSRAKYRVGIDVGGTNTDAVILRSTSSPGPDRDILAWSKVVTTPDVTSGIAGALQSVLVQSQIAPEDILYLSIGTTHFLNAVIEADPGRLSRVALLRLAGPYTKRCPPFIDFPPRLRKIIEGHVAIIDGGLEIDGKEIRPIREEQVQEQCRLISEKGIQNIVLVGVFSPIATTGTQEEYARKLIYEILGRDSVNVVCSKDVGHVGLLERENAAILNTSILSFTRRTVKAYQAVLAQLGLTCPLYLTQLDGTLIDAQTAVSVPIRTFSNGPTNSMRGAAYLAGIDASAREMQSSTIVVDVGGTTTDVGVLLPSGFPRKAAAFTEVGGVRTSFSMPDIHSIGLGGGSRIRFTTTSTGTQTATIGPDSVGHTLTSTALVYGGDTLTATDLAALSSPSLLPTLGPSAHPLSPSTLSPEQLASGQAALAAKLSAAIDRMKPDAAPADVLLVGGGGIVVPDAGALRGVRSVRRPPFFAVANAVGAAIARVAGTVDRVEILEGRNPADVVEGAKREAVRRAIEAGAGATSVVIAEVDVIQLPYVANHASRVIVRAVGDLDLDALRLRPDSAQQIPLDEASTRALEEEETENNSAETSDIQEPEPVDPHTYRPRVSPDGIWTLSVTDLEWISEGCAILGCGGGGATYPAFLMARQALREGHQIRVVGYDHSGLRNDMQQPSSSDRSDNGRWILPCGFMGSPSVSSERIPSGEEIPTACRSIMRFLGVSQEHIGALISVEIGGKNGLEPFLLATRDGFDYPVVDGDLMGRAYPKLHQILPCIFKENGLYPVAAADGVGNCMIVPAANSNPIVEGILRAACTALGSCIALSISSLRPNELQKHAICGTTSQAWRIGRAVAACQKSRDMAGIPHAITELQGGKCLFVGKIISVDRIVKGGFTHGQLAISPLLLDEQEWSTTQPETSANDKLIIPFQNENLHAYVQREGDSKQTLCVVPDLIAVLDSQSGQSIGTQDYRYGLRVTVIGLACDPRWTTPEGLDIGGPKAFGLDVPYQPIGEYKEPRSVIKEYRQRRFATPGHVL